MEATKGKWILIIVRVSPSPKYTQWVWMVKNFYFWQDPGEKADSPLARHGISALSLLTVALVLWWAVSLYYSAVRPDHDWSSSLPSTKVQKQNKTVNSKQPVLLISLPALGHPILQETHLGSKLTQILVWNHSSFSKRKRRALLSPSWWKRAGSPPFSSPLHSGHLPPVYRVYRPSIIPSFSVWSLYAHHSPLIFKAKKPLSGHCQ